MCLLMEARPWKDRWTFDKHSAHRVDRRQALFLQDRVQTAHHCTVGVAAQPITAVCRQWHPNRAHAFHQRLVGEPEPPNAGSGRKIETQAKLDYGPQDECLINREGLAFFASKIQRAPWIGFPEVDTRPKPVVLVFARP